MPGAAYPGTIFRDADAECLRADRAPHRSAHHQSFAVDADRNLVGVGVDDHLESGALSQTVLMCPMEQPGVEVRPFECTLRDTVSPVYR